MKSNIVAWVALTSGWWFYWDAHYWAALACFTGSGALFTTILLEQWKAWIGNKRR